MGLQSAANEFLLLTGLGHRLKLGHSAARSLRRAPSPSNTHSILWSMSTKDQLLHSALHGTAMRYAAERRNLDESIEELRQIADGRNDILAEAAGITAGMVCQPSHSRRL
jgi:hypothetical protein